MRRRRSSLLKHGSENHWLTCWIVRLHFGMQLWKFSIRSGPAPELQEPSWLPTPDSDFQIYLRHGRKSIGLIRPGATGVSDMARSSAAS